MHGVVMFVLPVDSLPMAVQMSPKGVRTKATAPCACRRDNHAAASCASSRQMPCMESTSSQLPLRSGVADAVGPGGAGGAGGAGDAGGM